MGIVHIHVVEGHVSSVEVEGSDRTGSVADDIIANGFAA